MRDSIEDRFLRSFEWHSSPIDWCEPNYAVTSSIVEYYNTVSNALFVLLASLLLYLFAPFARAHSRRVQIVWVLSMFICAGSAYFHATLSLAGQLLDEFVILWSIGTCVAFWFPKHKLTAIPGGFFVGREHWFERGMLVAIVVLTVLGCFWPLVNSVFLMATSLPLAVTFVYDVGQCRDTLARRVAYKALVYWLLAVTFWLSDRFACGFWLRLSLPGVHWLWHPVSFMSGYHAIVYMVYRDATFSAKNGRPTMRLWPSFEWKLLGVSYVELIPNEELEMDEDTGKNC